MTREALITFYFEYTAFFPCRHLQEKEKMFGDVYTPDGLHQLVENIFPAHRNSQHVQEIEHHILGSSCNLLHTQ